MKNVNEVLKAELDLIKPPGEVYEKIVLRSKEFVKDLKEKLVARKVKADVFIGGSLAKGTLVRKKVYDIDVFVRFDKKYKDKEISGLLGDVLCSEDSCVHGSRDYYKIQEDFEGGKLEVEVIPVRKISKPSEAVNVTDLSFFHVRYLLGEIEKNSRLVDEIRLAKTFSHAQNVYGAESYIHGFSGYALELLISHYGSFLKFVKEVVKLGDRSEKIVIDDDGFYGGHESVLREMNSSKITGPIVLVDPTFKERNACSSLSYETFFKFKEKCKKFLDNPSMKFFEVNEIGKEFNRFKDVKIVSVKTSKQIGDIAGTKSKKFFDFFVYKLKKEFDIKKSGFDYDDEENVAKFYFVVNGKEDELVRGPPIGSGRNLVRFRKVHPDSFEKDGFAWIRVEHKLGFEEWFKKFLREEKKIISEMDIVGVDRG